MVPRGKFCEGKGWENSISLADLVRKETITGMVRMHQQPARTRSLKLTGKRLAWAGRLSYVRPYLLYPV